MENVTNEIEIIQNETKNSSKMEKFYGAVFLSTVAGFSTIFGFGLTLAIAKKNDPKYFTKGIGMSPVRAESGASLAFRALGWGTLYAITGVGLLSFIVWKSLGVNDLKEFRYKVGSLLPSIPKNEMQGKSDFKTVRELVHYLIDEEKRKRGK